MIKDGSYWWNRHEKIDEGTLLDDKKHCYRCGISFKTWHGDHYYSESLNVCFCINCGKMFKKLFKSIKNEKGNLVRPYGIFRTMMFEDMKK